MGKANLKILAEAWLQIIENYCADFQEPYPPTEVLKDILDWMPTAEGDSLIVVFLVPGEDDEDDQEDLLHNVK